MYPGFSAEDITVKAKLDHNYATVNISRPLTTDNSGIQPKVETVPVIGSESPLKLKIGQHLIKVSARDASGNSAKCVFKVNVVGIKLLSSVYSSGLGTCALHSTNHSVRQFKILSLPWLTFVSPLLSSSPTPQPELSVSSGTNLCSTTIPDLILSSRDPQEDSGTSQLERPG